MLLGPFPEKKILALTLEQVQSLDTAGLASSTQVDERRHALEKYLQKVRSIVEYWRLIM
jgi:hypothetical protein